MNKKYKCPRCEGKNIQDLGKSIECEDCQLEFEKVDIENLDRDEVLAVKEKLAFIKSIKSNSDENHSESKLNKNKGKKNEFG